MRIVSGSLKGMTLSMPKGDLLRPTTGNIREAVFNILGQNLEGIDFIDLCSGTGAMGLEAISRSAATVLFVEQHRKVIQALRVNVRMALERLSECHPETRIFEENFEIFLNRGHSARVVYFDPPYEFFYAKEWSAKPYGKIVKPGGCFIIEHPKRQPRNLPEMLDGMKLMQTRNYGKSSLSIFQADALECNS